MSLPHNRKNLSLARALRRGMTSRERRLWYCFLSRYPIKFRRQEPIDQYIVDFYCHSAGLVIELDGDQHYSAEGEKKDSSRTEKLEEYGLTVLRFSNYRIDDNFDGVCREIEYTIERLMEEKCSP